MLLHIAGYSQLMVLCVPWDPHPLPPHDMGHSPLCPWLLTSTDILASSQAADQESRVFPLPLNVTFSQMH